MGDDRIHRHSAKPDSNIPSMTRSYWMKPLNVEAYYAASNVTPRNVDLVFLILLYFSQEKKLFDRSSCQITVKRSLVQGKSFSLSC
jgi:hypothetical protein